jgi:hypothetical protein
MADRVVTTVVMVRLMSGIKVIVKPKLEGYTTPVKF